jgi:hypothetical protein
MNDIPILFGKTIDDLRPIGALGGRAHARNCRARQKARLLTSSAPIPASSPPTQETTAEAVATLDAQFGSGARSGASGAALAGVVEFAGGLVVITLPSADLYSLRCLLPASPATHFGHVREHRAQGCLATLSSSPCQSRQYRRSCP